MRDFQLIRAPKRPKFSFVIPVYDRVREVKEAITSCLHQTLSDFEIVVVLDGSPPPTRAVVESFRSYDNVRIFAYAEPFGTACRARNKGIVESRGEFICLLDSDDLSDPCRLERVLRVLQTSPADVVYGSIRFITDAGRKIENIAFGDLAVPNPSGFSLDNLKESNQIYTLSASIRREVLLSYGGFRPEMRYREDYELWLRLKHHGASFAFTNEVLSIYRIHGGNNELNFKDQDAHWYQQSLRMYDKPFTDWAC